MRHNRSAQGRSRGTGTVLSVISFIFIPSRSARCQYLQYLPREYRINHKSADTDMTPADPHLMEWIQKKRERLEVLRPLDLPGG